MYNLNIVKTSCEERVDKINTIIQTYDRKYVTINIIESLQDFRSTFEEIIVWVNVMNTNPIVASDTDIIRFLDYYNNKIYECDLKLNAIEILTKRGL